MNKISKNISIAILPFILLMLIGLIKDNLFGLTDGITYHQKVFKTLLIFISDVILYFIFIIHALKWKEGINKQKKYILYFVVYFFFILVQFFVSFFSKEVSYDREYYLANYTFLIIFSMFTFIFLNHLEDIKKGIIIINIFFIMAAVWSFTEFFKADLIFTNFRPALSFGNTDYFAGFLIGLFPLSMISSVLFYNKNKKFSKNYFSIILFITGIFGIIPLVFTQTKAAWIAFYIGMSIFIISFVSIIDNLPREKKIPIILLLLSLLIIIPIAILFYTPPFLKTILARLLSAFENPMYFIKDRINGWTGAFGLFKDHPLFGAGLGTVYPSSFKYIGKYYYMYSDSNSFKHAHSEFVEVLGEAGIFGMILFFFLFGYILLSLFKRVYSKKYNFEYRLISLSIGTGLICMLVHQVFSLSLRMSVTMTAYFFLLGIGIFLISYSEFALINETDDAENNILPELLQKKIKLKETYLISGIILLLIIISFSLFLPLYRSEVNIVKFIKDESSSIEIKNYYLNKSVKLKSDNPYAWNQKYVFDNEILTISNQRGFFNEELSNEVKNDLDKLNSIIPGYQNIWAKYARFYLTRYIQYKIKWQKSFSSKDLDESKNSLLIALDYLNKSLNMNFLNDYDHIYKLLLLSEINNEREYKAAVKDYITARIYLDFAKAKKIIKENVNVVFGGKTELDIIDLSDKGTKKGKRYNFIISDEDADRISGKTYGISGLNNFDLLEKSLSEEIDLIINNLSQKK